MSKATPSMTKIEDARSPRQGDRAYVLEEQIGYLLRKAHQRATALFMANAAELQVTPTQFTALAKILEEGQVTQNRLGRLTAMDPATMQGVIKRLSERGLILRTADPTDRRRTLLALTATGRETVERAIPQSALTTEETLAPLTARERETFLRLLAKLT